MGLKSAKILFNKPSFQRWDTSDIYYIINLKSKKCFMKYFLFTSSTFIAVVILKIALALWLGGPGTPAPIASINDPFKSVDFSDMPALKNHQGAYGVKLFYREYVPVGEHHQGSAVLVHGSSASSSSMHPMAQALAAAGVQVFALDIRGHGASGVKGHID
jgi:hypothetical protein